MYVAFYGTWLMVTAALYLAVQVCFTCFGLYISPSEGSKPDQCSPRPEKQGGRALLTAPQPREGMAGEVMSHGRPSP